VTRDHVGQHVHEPREEIRAALKSMGATELEDYRAIA